MAAHALLGASSAHRWLECTPSARLEERAGIPDEGSPFAAEGTAAHEYAELELSYRLGEINRRSYAGRLKKHKATEWWGPEMEEAVGDYASYVCEQVEGLKAEGKTPYAYLEQRVDYSEFVPGGFGTADAVILSDGEIHVIDLKYGKGVPVSAEGNPQLRLYALGAALAYMDLFCFDDVHMTIVQPRLGSVSSDSMSLNDLLDWAEFYVKPRALKADAGEGELRPSEHACRWCRVKAVCRARAEASLKAACEDFSLDSLPESPEEAEMSVPLPDLLEVEEVAELLPLLPAIEAWAKDVQEWALAQARDRGTRFPGYKLVEGRSNRKVVQPGAAMDALSLEGFAASDYQKPAELVPIGKLEKLLGKARFAEVLGAYVDKPAGKPALVPESDKRPEISSAESAAADFADEGSVE